MTAPSHCSSCGAAVPSLSDAGLCLACASSTEAGQPASGANAAPGKAWSETDAPTFVETSPPASDAPAPAEPRNGLRDYQILNELGRGGMGVVFKARQISLNRTVALKMILAGEFAGETAVKRFHAEAEAAAHLDHPNIVSIYEIGEHEGQHFFSMKLVEGESLSRQIPQLMEDPRAAARMLIKIARAVHYAHQRGIIHRDLKPGNILIDAHGEPHVTDFGLATRVQSDSQLTLSGAILGTPSYMSPEQAAGQTRQLTTATDVYSLGAVFYHMLAGHPPFIGESSVRILRRVLEEEAPPLHKLRPRIDRDLDTICLKCLEKDPTRRYGSAEALADDLERWLRFEPIVARPGTRLEKIHKWVRRKPVVTALIAGLVFVAVMGFSGVVSQWKRAERKATESNERLVRLNVVSGVRSAKEGDLAGALLWFTEAFRLDNAAGQQEDVHRIRIGSVLQQTPQLRHVWFHDQTVWLAQLSPAQDRIAIISGPSAVANRFDRAELRVWDFASGESISPPVLFSGGRPPMYRIRYQVFSPDGRKIVTVQAHDTPQKTVVSKIHLLDSASGKELLPALELDGLVSHVEFSPNGELLVAAGRAQSSRAPTRARVWDLKKNGTLIAEFPHQAWITIASFSPDNRLLLTGSWDKTAKLWDLASSTPLFVFDHTRWLFDAQFSHDGQRIVTAASDLSGGEARVWDVKTGKQICTLDNGQGSIAGVLYQASFSPNDQQIAIANFDGSITLWDAATGRMVLPPFKHNHGTLTAEFAPDGKRLLSASFDLTARLWTTQQGGAQQAVLNQCSFVLGATFTRDGQQLVTASADHMVRAWTLPTQPADRITLHHSNKVLHAEFSHDGRRVLTASRDHTARVWDAQTGQALFPPLMHRGAVYHATFSPDDKLIVTASADRTARIWDATTGEQLGPDLQHSNQVWHAQFDRPGARIVTASGQFRTPASGSSSLVRDFAGPEDPQSDRDDEARVWDVRTGQPLTPPLAHNDAVVYAAFTPDAQRIVTASADRTAQLWQLPQGAKIGAPMRHKAMVFRATFSPDGQWLATVSGGAGSLDKAAAEFWNLNSGEPIGRVFEHLDVVYSAAFSRDSRRLVTASEDGTAHVWDTESGQPLTPPMIAGSIVLGASFSPDERFILTTCGDGILRLWDSMIGELISQLRLHDDRLNASAFSPDGKRILTASDDGTAKIMALPYTDYAREDLVLLAQVLSARRIISQGSLAAELEPLDEREFARSWTLLSEKLPDRFGLSRARR